MESHSKPPATLIEAIRYFSDPDVCVAFVASLRWPDGPQCPSCDGTEYSYLTTRRLWKCKRCKKQYSVKVGTIFEDSPIPLDKWLTAIWLIANSKNGISSYELARHVGLSQKSGWFVLHRIRLAMQTGSFRKLAGEIEVDESYIGGRSKWMHKAARARRIKGRGPMDKTPVVGMKERGGDIHAHVPVDTKRATLHGLVRTQVEPGSAVYTDSHPSYVGLDEDFDHDVVDHTVEYVRGRVHVNGVENFWALLRRSLKGTYVKVAPEHLFRYVDERVFCFNKRKLDDFGRFLAVLGQVTGRRITYAELTGGA